jgi:hypothetical protein
MADAVRGVPVTVGRHRAGGQDATVAEVGGPDADGLAAYLLGLRTPLTVLDPPEVRDALRVRWPWLARTQCRASQSTMSATTAGSTCWAGSYSAGVDWPLPRKNRWLSAS